MEKRSLFIRAEGEVGTEIDSYDFFSFFFIDTSNEFSVLFVDFLVFFG